MPPRLLRIWRAERDWAFPAALLFIWLSAFAFIAPLDYDESVYLLVARGMREGHWPYRDIWDNKPPLNYLWYMPGALAGDYHVQRIFGAGVCAGSVGIFSRVSRRWLEDGEVPFGIWSYALLLANPFVEAGIEMETFLLLPLLCAVAVSSAFLAGGLLAIAVMTKPTALLLAPVFIFLWKRDWWRTAIGGAVVCVAVVAPFAPIWRDLWTANVSFNRDFAEYGAGEYGLGKRLGQLLSVAPGAFLGSVPIWIAAMVGLVRVRRTFVLLWCACAVAAIKVNGYAAGTDYPHYYMLLFVPLALAAAPGLRQMTLRPRLRLMLAGSALGTTLLVAVGLTAALTRDDPGDPVVDAINRSEGEFYMLGGHPEFYLLAERYPQRRWFFDIPLIVNEDWGAELRASLRECPPAVLVIDVPQEDTHDPFPLAWAEEVAPLYANREDFDGFAALTDPIIRCR